MKVRKAIIPAAGLGTRFLPATKAIAKEMLTAPRPPAEAVPYLPSAKGGIPYPNRQTAPDRQIGRAHV